MSKKLFEAHVVSKIFADADRAAITNNITWFQPKVIPSRFDNVLEDTSFYRYTGKAYGSRVTLAVVYKETPVADNWVLSKQESGYIKVEQRIGSRIKDTRYEVFPLNQANEAIADFVRRVDILKKGGHI